MLFIIKFKILKLINKNIDNIIKVVVFSLCYY